MFKLNKYAQFKHADPMQQVIKQGAQSSCTVSVITRKNYATGSGFHVGHGLIVTAAHVVADTNRATSISVTFDGLAMYPASLVTSDSKIDAAILKVNGIPNHINHIEFADSNQVERGELVAVIASPEGFHDTSMVGRITNIHQSPDFQGSEPAWNDLMLIDVNLLPGSSGGMVLNADAKLIGIVLGIIDRTGQNQPIVGLNSVQPSNKLVSLVADALTKISTKRKINEHGNTPGIV